MSNILVITPIYPAIDLDKSNTPVVHYFVKHWKKQGAKVYVIHSISYYPLFFYLIANLPFARPLLTNLLGVVIPKKRISKPSKYTYEDVEVYRLPIFKLFPHAYCSPKELEKKTKEICGFIDYTIGQLDSIVAHWQNSQLYILYSLKQRYPKVKTTLVLHDNGRNIKNMNSKYKKNLLSGVDKIGFRSISIKNEFQKLYGFSYKSFLCYSGIPEEMLYGSKRELSYISKLNKFIYVGRLIKRKYPVELLLALIEKFPSRDFQLTYIGEGPELKKIKLIIKKNEIENNVKLLSQVDRSVVFNELQKSDIFVMISKNEAFGLVYLEALAAGCITIASKNEGFDGIIIDGVNGFLSTAGSVDGLIKTISTIYSLSDEKRREIIKNGFKTAEELSASKCAQSYLKEIL